MTERQQLTEEEIAAVRKLLEEDRRTRWLWESARTWALWITAVVAGVSIGLQTLRDALKRLLS